MAQELTYEGDTKPVRDWAKQLGVRPQVIWARLRKGRSPEEALSSPRRRYPARIVRGRDALIDLDRPFESDPLAQLVVRAYPDGLTLEAVGALVGWSREKVRQVEEAALRKLREVQHGAV